jgi:hypothetical protein
VRIESGFELLLTLDHLALAPLAQSSEPLTVQLWYADDAGYEWRCEVIPRLHGTDTQGRLLWAIRDVATWFVGPATSDPAGPG